MRLLAAVFALLLAAPLASAQSLWTDVSEASLRPAPGARVTVPSAYRLVRLDGPQMAARLDAARGASRPGAATGETLQIPLPDGTFATVRTVEASVMAAELQARFPEIRTYLAEGDGSVSGRLSLTPAGFRGMLFTPQGTVFLDPYARGDAEHLVVYYGRDLQVDRALRGRTEDEVIGDAPPPRRDAPRANGATLRTYRLAVAATGEYTAYHGGTVAGGLAAIVTTINRVTGIYERDLSVRFQLVANNNLLVYTNAATDPYQNTSGDLSANIATINSVIGSANYDVGHLVGTGGGGVAGLGVICTSNKARGLTGSPAPVGDAFDVDYVAHEMGHQFGGNHTFNGNAGSCGGGNRNATTAYEPGSGSTIQAYAGICGAQNLQSNSDAYFHAASLDEMTAHITTGSGGTCGTATATNNTIPTVTAPVAFTIPTGTPFALTGSATDNTPAALSYTWEELDLGAAGAPGSATPPLFRSFLPTASPTRYFPQLPRLVAGLAPVIGERLPTDARAMTFRLTARDNRAGGGAINDASTVVTTVNTGAPFAVTFASAANQSYAGTATVTWNVAGTNTGAVNTPTVDILFSTNNGATFPTVLAAATPNDGSQAVSFPVATTQGRILVRAVGNVFFNVNPQRFTVTSSLPPPSASLAPAAVSTEVAPDATRTAALTLANTAAPGAAPLTFSASVQNLTTTPTRPAEAAALARERREALEVRIAAATAEAPRAKGDRSRDNTGAPALRAGGPDTFGYTYRDSDEAGGPAVAFQTLAGTPLTWTAASTFAAADEGYADVALPFAFPFYGAAQTSVRVYTNGFLTFSGATGDTFTNTALPNAAVPNAVIAPFWDDLDLTNAGAARAGLLPDGRFAVVYSGVRRYQQGTDNLTFEALLSPDGTVEFQYGTMTGALTGATAGIENATGTDGLTVVSDAAYLTSNRAVRFVPPVPPAPPWLTVAPPSGSVAPGASAALTLAFDATGLAEGTYTADVVVATNASSNPTRTVPVTLRVSQTGVVAGVAGWRMLAPAAAGMTVDDLAAMNLVQGVPGYYPPPQAQPNLYTGYDGTGYTTSGTGAVLASGRGLFWNFYDLDLAPGGPSNSTRLPTTLATTRTPVTADTPVALSTAGDGFNLLGNPFDVSLNVSNIGSWPGASRLASTVAQVWDPNAGTYDSSLLVPHVAPWQGFWLEAGTAGSLTIPASARTTGGTLQREAPQTLVTFELAQADGPLRDRAAVLVLSDDATDGRDALDAVKLAPLASAHVLLAFGEGDALRSIESRPLAPVTLPLGVASVGAGEALVLSWPRLDALPDGWAATLRDLETGAVVDLAERTGYAFTVAPQAARAAGTLPVQMRASALPARFELTVGPRGTVATETAVVAELALGAPRPNPARGTAHVSFSLAEAGAVRVSVVDLLGREVAVLAQGERPAGRHAETLDARQLAPGVYVVRLATNGQALTRRLVVVR